MRSHIIETVVIVWVWLGWLRVREGNVMTTKIVTLITRLVIHCSRFFHVVLVNWFPCRSIIASEKHWRVLRLFMRHFFHLVWLCAVLADHKEILNLFADDRVFRLVDRLLPASKVIVAENCNLIIFLVLGKHRINQENGWQKSFWLYFNRFHVTVAHVEGLELWQNPENWIFDSCLCVSLFLSFSELVTGAQLSLNCLPLRAMIGWTCITR